MTENRRGDERIARLRKLAQTVYGEHASVAIRPCAVRVEHGNIATLEGYWEQHKRADAAEKRIHELEAQIEGASACADRWRTLAVAELEDADGDPAVAMARKICAADLSAALK